MLFPEIEHEAYVEAVAIYQRLAGEAREAVKLLEGLRGSVRVGEFPDGSPRYHDGDLTAAIQADDADRARAAVEGKRDPGRKREDKVRAVITEAVDRVRILGQAADDAEDAVQVVLTTQAAEIKAAIDAATEQALAEYRRALTQVQEARQAFWRSKRLGSWVGRPERPFSAAQPPGLAALRHLSQNGEPVPGELIWTALAAEVTVPEPVRRALRYDTKVERIEGGGRVIEERLISVPVYAEDDALALAAKGVPVPYQPGVLSVGNALVLMPDTGDNER